MTKELVWKEYPRYDDPVLFDARGHRRTGSLFAETTQDTNRDPIFTLKDYDKKGIPSAYQLYMTSIDEYDAAMKLVGSMTHWRKLLACSWFMNGDMDKNITGLDSWRRDMAARDASTAKTQIMEKIQEGDRQAAQYMLTYATKGATAGIKQSSKAKNTRRGSQLLGGDVINLDKAFAKILEKG